MSTSLLMIEKCSTAFPLVWNRARRSQSLGRAARERRLLSRLPSDFSSRTGAGSLLMAKTITDLIRKMQRQLGLTQMVVTHDIANCAEKVADRLALLSEGKFVFIGTIDELYASDHPVVKEFVEEDRIRFQKEKETA